MFSGKQIALFGLGHSGLITAHALISGGADVIAFDDNYTVVEKASKLGIPIGNLRDIHWQDVSALVLTPGVPLTHPHPHWSVEYAGRAGVEVIGDIELFYRQMLAEKSTVPVVAITGTNGKSTTTALIAHILSVRGWDVQMGGNIGRAVLDLAPPSLGSIDQVYIIECSSYQIDLAPSLRPNVGVLLNLSTDHIDRHGTIENYVAVKEQLVKKSDIAIISIDSDSCRKIANAIALSSKSLLTIGEHKDAHYNYESPYIWDQKGRRIADLSNIGSLRGKHNMQNAAAAIAVCQSLGVSKVEIQIAMISFSGLSHRLEQVRLLDGVLFVNDSKATNADAAAAALSSFENVFWIAGGMIKDIGISATLLRSLSHVEKAYLIGKDAKLFSVQLGDKVPYEISNTLKEAVNHAAWDARQLGKSPVVLLSPAAASFDQFSNFEERGESFKNAVKALDPLDDLR